MVSLSLLLAVLIFFLGMWVYVRHYFDPLGGDCGQEIHAEISSQLNTYAAREVVTNCGATTDFATQILIKNTSTAVEKTVLSLKGDHSKSCNIEWQDDMTLKVSCDGYLEDVYSRVDSFEGVKIVYDKNILQSSSQ